MFVFGVGFQIEDDVRAGFGAFRRRNGIAVCAGRFPDVGFVFPKFAGDDADLLGDHECGIEADAELTDDVDIVALLHFLLEAE